MQYLALISERTAGAAPASQQKPVHVKVLSSSPILEAFGNAKTIRNQNSSRFVSACLSES